MEVYFGKTLKQKNSKAGERLMITRAESTRLWSKVEKGILVLGEGARRCLINWLPMTYVHIRCPPSSTRTTLSLLHVILFCYYYYQAKWKNTEYCTLYHLFVILLIPVDWSLNYNTTSLVSESNQRQALKTRHLPRWHLPSDHLPSDRCQQH